MTHFKVDMHETVALKNSVVKELTGGIAGLFKSYGIELVQVGVN